MLGTFLICLLETALAGGPAADGLSTTSDVPEQPQVEPDIAASDASPEEFGAALTRARELYFAGGHDRALEQLTVLRRRFQAGEDVDPQLVDEALTYLGEVQYQLGDQAGAWETFELILGRNPEHTVSPYHHPTEVIAWFELVRRKVLQANDDAEQAAQPLPPPPPMPGWGYAPLGIPQLAQGQVARGLLFGGAQVGFGIGSLVTYARLHQINGEDHPKDLEDHEVKGFVQSRRWLVQFPLTTGFYVAWVGSSVDARRTWNRTARPQPVIGVAADASGRGMLTVSGRL